MGKPLTSARKSALSFGNVGGVDVLIPLRRASGLVDVFSKCIEADRGFETLCSAPANAELTGLEVPRLLLWALIAMSFLCLRTRLRRPDGLIVQRISSVIPSCGLAWQKVSRCPLPDFREAEMRFGSGLRSSFDRSR
jgi:hypothetical protein